MAKKNDGYFAVKVEFLDGKKKVFQLPNDLQDACWQWKEDNPTTWKELLTNALINVPVEPYTEKNNYQPLMRVVKVKSFFILKKPRRSRTRGQFLTIDNWTRAGVGHFWESLRFLHHDFKLKTRIYQTLDYARWRRKNKR